MGAEDKSEKAYDKKADNYNNTFDGRFTEKFKQILQNEVVLQKNYKLLDVACGNGELVSRFLKNNDIKGFGIDISGNMIENAKLLCPQGSFKKSNCEHTGFERNFFDVITVSAAYHHFPNVHLFAKECHRILKKDGRLYIAEVYLPNVLRLLINPFIKLSKEGDVKIYSTLDIISNFEEVGFVCSKKTFKGFVQLLELQKK